MKRVNEPEIPFWLIPLMLLLSLAAVSTFTGCCPTTRLRVEPERVILPDSSYDESGYGQYDFPALEWAEQHPCVVDPKTESCVKVSR